MADTFGLPIAIVGAGRVACALGRLLRESGAPVHFIAGRDTERSRRAAEFIGGVEPVGLMDVATRAQRVLIAVSDSVVSEVAAELARAGFSSGIALHTSGSRGPEALAPLGKVGVATGVLHPLQTIPTPEFGVEALPGSFFAAAGQPSAMDWAVEIVEALDGKLLAVRPEAWPLYHAAAVMASNYQVTLLDAALEMLEQAGVPPAEGLAALGPIVRATLENTLRLGPQEALTGPIARGDAGTVRSNRKALGKTSAATQELYRVAGLRTLAIAGRRGLSPQRMKELHECL